MTQMLPERLILTFRRRPRAAFLFAVALLLTGFFAVQVLIDAMHWQPHGPRPVEPWMTMRLIAHMHGLSPQELDIAAGLPLPGRDGPRTLAEHAAARGVPVEQIIAEVDAAIARLSADGEQPDQ
ncbi:hypothetical protein [Pelagovum pacificum]|uniref:hypothetical protein n=1 Tax=Pelagovum pacificum TaxID=2588711 RepID=UPI0018CD293F|nr:hypothetical protein [Pelagovum pacificum]QQA44622.1 hypothetical protein I8N54_08655 [Pelagovum pacificum]